MNKFKGLMSIGLAISLLVGCGNGGDTPKSNASKDILPQIEKLVSEEKLGEANDLILETVENNIQPIYDEWETLKNEVNTYEKYVEYSDQINEFYNSVIYKSKSILVDNYDYSLKYALTLLDLDRGNDTKYDLLKEMKDGIYDKALKDFKKSIYDDLLKEIKNFYYDELLKDVKDELEYAEWSDTRSDFYKLWSDTRSDFYKLWSDTRSALYSEESTKDIISNFEKLVDKRKSGDWEDKKEEPKKSENEKVEKEEIKEPVKEEPQQTQPSTTSDVREFLDSYEQFMNQYVEFMKTFDADSSTPEMLSEYSNLMKEFAEFGEKAESYNTDNISDEDYAYYLEVMARIQQKMLEVM